jgi:hypothetical protein
MNTQEHLLVVLMEECAEVQKECAKALRFGLEDRRDKNSPTNREKIQSELDDLIGTFHLLRKNSILEESCTTKQQQKMDKVIHHMDIARESGVLVD